MMRIHRSSVTILQNYAIGLGRSVYVVINIFCKILQITSLKFCLALDHTIVYKKVIKYIQSVEKLCLETTNVNLLVITVESCPRYYKTITNTLSLPICTFTILNLDWTLVSHSAVQKPDRERSNLITHLKQPAGPTTALS